jgi:hypothetical protein
MTTRVLRGKAVIHAEAYQPYATDGNGSASHRIMHAIDIFSSHLCFLNLFGVVLLSRVIPAIPLIRAPNI